MPTTQTLNEKLFNTLKSRGYDPTPLDDTGRETPTASDASIIQFDFVKNTTNDKTNNFGSVTIALDNNNLNIYFNRSVTNSPRESINGDLSWLDFIKMMKKFATANQFGFELMNQDKLSYDMKKRASEKREKLGEGYYPLSSRRSGNDVAPNVKIILKHNKRLDDGVARHRNISEIFIQNAAGERFKVPTKNTRHARIFARHVAAGGTPYDERGTHIAKMIDDYRTLRDFLCATRCGQYTPDAQQLIITGSQKFSSLCEVLTKLERPRGYNSYFSMWSPGQPSQSSAIEDRWFNNGDPRIVAGLPLVVSSVVELGDSLEDSLSDVVLEAAYTQDDYDEMISTLTSSDMVVGADASNVKNILVGVLDNDDLRDVLYQLSERDSMANPLPEIISWLESQSGSEYEAVLHDLGNAPELPPEDPESDADSENIAPDEDPDTEESSDGEDETDKPVSDSESDTEDTTDDLDSELDAAYSDNEPELKEEQVQERSVSEKQRKFMAAAAHNPEFAKKAGIKQSVAKEFNRADVKAKSVDEGQAPDDIKGAKNRIEAYVYRFKKNVHRIVWRKKFPSPSLAKKWAVKHGAKILHIRKLHKSELGESQGDMPLECSGYRYNQKRQRTPWQETFQSIDEANKWADSHNATIVNVTDLGNDDVLVPPQSRTDQYVDMYESWINESPTYDSFRETAALQHPDMSEDDASWLALELELQKDKQHQDRQDHKLKDLSRDVDNLESTVSALEPERESDTSHEKTQDQQLDDLSAVVDELEANDDSHDMTDDDIINQLNDLRTMVSKLNNQSTK